MTAEKTWPVLHVWVCALWPRPPVCGDATRALPTVATVPATQLVGWDLPLAHDVIPEVAMNCWRILNKMSLLKYLQKRFSHN